MQWLIWYKPLRDLYFDEISNALLGYVVYNLDMKSCYISFLVALYSEKAKFLEEPLKEGIWKYKYMKRLHSKSGNALSFNKSFAKLWVCKFFPGRKVGFQKENSRGYVYEGGIH